MFAEDSAPVATWDKSGWNRWKFRRSIKVTSTGLRRSPRAQYRPPNPPPTMTTRCHFAVGESFRPAAAGWLHRSRLRSPPDPAHQFEGTHYLPSNRGHLRTDTDVSVTDIGKGHYLIDRTGVEVRSNDPAAP
jgi:hypothetical protein